MPYAVTLGEALYCQLLIDTILGEVGPQAYCGVTWGTRRKICYSPQSSSQ